MRLPLLERKARLEALLADAPPVLRFTGHIIGNGARVFEEGSKLGVEGMIPQRVDFASSDDGLKQLSGRCQLSATETFPAGSTAISVSGTMPPPT